jgi:maleate cis-trans isomerase
MHRIRLGMLTPSSNTVLEPVTTEMLRQLPEVSAHFGRFRVTEISLSKDAIGQFDNTAILEAAGLLADAKVDVIAWNGTSSGWLGFDTDSQLCAGMTEATTPAVTYFQKLISNFSRQSRRQSAPSPRRTNAAAPRGLSKFQCAGIHPSRH